MVVGIYVMLLSCNAFVAYHVLNYKLPRKRLEQISSPPQIKLAVSLPIPRPAQVKSASTKKSASQNGAVNTATIAPIPDVAVPPCNPPSFTPSSDRLIAKLQEYRSICIDVESYMIFLSVPITKSQVSPYASDIARILKLFANANIKPLVIFEPSEPGTDFSVYSSGGYDTLLKNYFNSIKQLGITDAQMGMWVHMPEANTPAWQITLPPASVASCINHSGQAQKSVFPGSQVTTLLDSSTYGPALDWSDGRTVSLLPYVQPIKAGLLDSFGLQGFPWQSAKSKSPISVYDATSFLKASLAIEAARSLGVPSVWLNTGTYRSKYSGSSQVMVDAQNRITILQSILAQADTVKNAGLQTSINIFAEDKSAVQEATDWSYWHTGSAGKEDSIVLQTFAQQLKSRSMSLWIYDTL